MYTKIITYTTLPCMKHNYDFMSEINNHWQFTETPKHTSFSNTSTEMCRSKHGIYHEYSTAIYMDLSQSVVKCILEVHIVFKCVFSLIFESNI
jgi:hypothetical protein